MPCAVTACAGSVLELCLFELLARGITLPGRGEQQGTVPTTKALCCGVALQLCMGETATRTVGKKRSDELAQGSGVP